jgi:hypothetical protein
MNMVKKTIEVYSRFDYCNDIFALSCNIRFAWVIDTMEKLISGGMRHGLKPMEDNENSQKLYVEFALRSLMLKKFDEKFGKTVRL